MKALNRGIWRVSISLRTKLRLYNVYYTSSTSLQSRHMEYDCNVQTTSWCLRLVVPAIYHAHPIHGTCHRSGSPLQNRSTTDHFPPKVATAKAVWPYCPSRTGSRPCTRTANFHQSKLISIHLTLASIQHVVQPIVPPGGVWWKQPCSLTGVPLHDDDEACPSCHPNNSVKALDVHAKLAVTHLLLQVKLRVSRWQLTTWNRNRLAERIVCNYWSSSLPSRELDDWCRRISSDASARYDDPLSQKLQIEQGRLTLRSCQGPVQVYVWNDLLYGR